MSQTVIKFENLSKLYRLGEVGTGTISHDLNRWWRMNILGQPDPYTKVGHTNDRSAKAEKGEVVWALKDIDFEVKEGEVLGIIGKNGAGKSTLLKILSKVTSPTTGCIKVKGRIASLLEVGTGFNPEMTGRENIYMNGTIMGMRKWEIDKKLDEIIDFAGVAKYIDTPVKRYSSGMTVRLGFAVAAHLEPEILVVDEVLAVGDAEFQKKCLGKMEDVSTKDGRTILFVSHNLSAIKQLCKHGLVLNNGKLAINDNISKATNYYLNLDITSKLWIYKNKGDKIKITKGTSIVNGIETDEIYTGDNVILRLYYKKLTSDPIKSLSFSYTLYQNDILVTNLWTDYFETNFESKNEGIIDCIIPNWNLREGEYNCSIYVHIQTDVQDFIDYFLKLRSTEKNIYSPNGTLNINSKGLIFMEHNWQTL